jgi:type II secretory pathway pseudopilin PulG
MSLVELLVAMVILLTISLALMQTALVSIDYNTRNEIRNEAVKLAAQYMSDIRSTDFADMAEVNATEHLKLRRIPYATATDPGFEFFNVATLINTVGNVNTRQIFVNVSWTWKLENYTHSITSIRHASE